jgi:hypothetical protein
MKRHHQNRLQSTAANKGLTGIRIYPHRHVANQLHPEASGPAVRT